MTTIINAATVVLCALMAGGFAWLLIAAWRADRADKRDAREAADR